MPADPRVRTNSKAAQAMSDADLCRANGWGAGTVLIGEQGYGPDEIRITAIGERSILAISKSSSREESWTLHHRDWRKVSRG